jgi:hypothetical protein
MFITVFTRALTGPYPEPDGSSPYLSLRSVLILSTNLYFGLPGGLFPSGFPANILYEFLLYYIHATCPPHLILLNSIILIKFGEEYKLWSASLYSFLQPPANSSLYGQNILLSALFSNTFSLCTSLNLYARQSKLHTRLLEKIMNLIWNSSCYGKAAVPTEDISSSSSSWFQMKIIWNASPRSRHVSNKLRI